MGKYNSSTYRVRPLMECIENDYHAFLSLLSLVGIDPLSQPTSYRYDGVSCNEMQLKPTKNHLLALLARMATKQHGKVPITDQNRSELFFGNPNQRKAAYEKAKTELEATYDRLTVKDRPWYMFEGYTHPDIFIEGEDYVIVCEGKWTEPHITTTTTYLSSFGEYRSQMVRHIQGALNYSDKNVYAFYIADADCGYLDDLSRERFSQQLERETITIGNDEKDAILESFFGFTTWQDIHRVLPQITFQDKGSIP